MNQNDLHDLTSRTERLVDAISGAVLSTVEVAAERISLAAEVARVAQRMSAFAGVLEAIGAQKDALAARLADARGPIRTLIQRQIEVLTMQETGVLEKAGAPPDAARLAVETVDGGDRDVGEGGGRVYVREGRRFARLGAAPAAATNGAANGTAPPAAGA